MQYTKYLPGVLSLLSSLYKMPIEIYPVIPKKKTRTNASHLILYPFLFFFPPSLLYMSLSPSLSANLLPLSCVYPSDDQLGSIISITAAVVMVPISPLVQSLILSKQSLIALIHH